MRVIAGSLKGRRLKAPTWAGLRPTSDTLRETLFNVLAPRVGAARVLDGFAGTGGLGIEALSRGAAHVTFLERDAPGAGADRREPCALRDRGGLCYHPRQPRPRGRYAAIEAQDSRRSTSSCSIRHTTRPPPQMLETLAGADSVLAADGLVVLEHARRQPAPDRAGRLVLTRRLVSGDSALAFYQRQPDVRKPEPEI